MSDAARREVRMFADAEQVSRAAAEEFVRLAGEALAARGRFSVALSGGNTPRRLYQVLAQMPFHEQVDWPRVEFFWGDERALSPDHPDSNFFMACEALLRRMPISDSHIHRMQADRADREAAARDYQAEIAHAFRVPLDGDPPAFDLVLLGMGPDGHTASLFPYTQALSETRRWVVCNYVPKFTTYRLTMTPVIINQAANVVLLVTGADKANVLAEVLEGPRDPTRLPSQLIAPTTGKLNWFIDRIAGGRLARALTPGGAA